MKTLLAFLFVYACLLGVIYTALVSLAPGSVPYIIAGIQNELRLATGD